MTGRQLILSGLALLQEGEEQYYTYDAGASLRALNILLAECFTINNSIRISRGLDEMAKMPMLTGIDDEIPYEDLLVRTALPYGMAGKLIADDDFGKSQYLTAQYALHVNRAMRARAQPISDVYGGSDADY